MFVFPAFVVVPENGSDWLTNAKSTGAVIVWFAAVLVALGVIGKVRLRRETETRPAVTIGSAFGAVVRYFAGPFARWFAGVVRDANADQFDTLRAENTEQHAETSHRLSAVETQLVTLTERVDALEQITNPSGLVHDLAVKVDELAETVRVNRHDQRDAMNVVTGSVQLLADEIRELRVKG